MRPWIAMYSRTGSEISELSRLLNRQPDLIITNREDNHELLKSTIKPKVNITTVSNRPSSEELFLLLSMYNNPIITLHGWMRIIPKEICNKFEIYNGHPGLITEYPELKGKDPQDRAWTRLVQKGDLPRAGCVIHKVTPEVDEGTVMISRGFTTKGLDKWQFFSNFRYISTQLWVEFLNPIFR
jgi:folate-dependent phosphoribosylglycinamide formyltransferase PurN